MFRAARFIIQHKISVIAIIGIGAFMAMPSETKEDGPKSPWDMPSETSSVAAAEDEGMVDQIIAEADTMLAESGFDPREGASASTDRFGDTADSFAGANSN